jgi:hypothetical protein
LFRRSRDHEENRDVIPAASNLPVFTSDAQDGRGLSCPPMTLIKRLTTLAPITALAFVLGACGDDAPADDAGADSGSDVDGGGDLDAGDDVDAPDDLDGGEEPVGASCEEPFVANDPSAQSGMLAGHTNVSDGTCQEGGGVDFVYQVTPQYTGVLHISLSSVADLGIYVQTTCGDPETELGCADLEGGGVSEVLDVDVEAGVPLFVFIGGYNENATGNFTLQVISEENVPVPPETDCENLDDDDQDGAMDCDDPTACQTLPACAAGEGALGSACDVQTQCAASSNDPFCYSELTWGYPGGACSEFCSLEAEDCPGDGVCLDVNLGNGHGLCFDGCSEDSCRDGYVCDVEGGSYCRPGCTDSAQCSATGYCDVGNGYCVAQEICDNGVDDNGNYRLDCEDAQCVGFETCAPLISAACEGAITAVLGDNAGSTAKSSTAVLGTNCTGGYGALEDVYTFTPGTTGETGTLTLTLASATDQGIYIRTSCADPLSQLACTDQFEGGTIEQIEQDVEGGVPLTIVVDGWFDPGYAGPYVLNVAYEADVVDPPSQ